MVGNYTLQFSANDGLLIGSAITHITVAPPTVANNDALVITPSITGPVAVGSQVTVGLTLLGSLSGGQPPPIQLQVTGANPQSVTINPTGNLYTFTYFGANAGVDSIVALATICCFANLTSNTATVTWVIDQPRLSGSPVTGRFFADDGTGVFNIQTTQQPLFTATFPNINFNAGSATLTRPFTDTVTDGTGNVIGVIPAQGNNQQAGVGSLYTFAAVFTGILNVPAPGPVTFTLTSDDAFVFGVGNGATRVSGPQTSTPSNSTFQGYPVMGGVNQREAATMSTITVNFPASGPYPFELDYAKGGDAKLTLTMQAGGLAIPPAAVLALSPNAPASLSTGSIQTVNVNLTDPSGAILAGQPVTVNVTGINTQSDQLTTDSLGQAHISYAGAPVAGSDQVQASALVNGVMYVSNIVTVPWNNGTNQPPVVSAGSPQTITLPGQAILSGFVTDDGMPNNTLTITWSCGLFERRTGFREQAVAVLRDGVDVVHLGMAIASVISKDVSHYDRSRLTLLNFRPFGL